MPFSKDTLLPKSMWPTDQEYKIAQKFQFPVHAVGYNWIQSNRNSAQHLLEKIEEFIGAYQKAGFTCEQVILVSHSMGGLVTRICQNKEMDKNNRILGIVHGVMPAIGAPLLYRRVVAGIEGGGNASLDLKNIFPNIAGRNTEETTPIVANSPGALELLPSHLYPPGWLKGGYEDPSPPVFTLPSKDDPYTEIYKQKDAWYRLVNPELLDPAGMHKRKDTQDSKNAENAEDVAWEAYIQRMNNVEKVHRNLLKETDYHPNTYVFYGEGESSFAEIRWQLEQKPETEWTVGGFTKEEILKAVPQHTVFMLRTGSEIREIGINHSGVRWATTAQVLMQDSTGDQTVPVVSGQAPGKTVSNICRLKGFVHADAYNAGIAQEFALLGITKLATLSKLSQE